MNEIFVYVKGEGGRKIYIGTFDDLNTLESDVWVSMTNKGLTQYKNKTFMLLGAEIYQLKF